MTKSKKGISEVITTVLLVLLAVTAVVIISGVLIPYINNLLRDSKGCSEVSGTLFIDTESGYTCYYNTSSVMMVNVTIERAEKDNDLEFIKIVVNGGGSSNSFNVKAGETGIVMDDGSNLTVPPSGEKRTYSLTTSLKKIDSIKVAPTLKTGKTCEATDEAKIEAC